MANTQAHSQKCISFLLTQDLPFIATLSKQIAAGKVGELHQCGCHGFAFEVHGDANVPPLNDGQGPFYEMAFTSNFPEEIDMLLFTDERGYLSWVDVTYGAANIAPMPEGVIPSAKIGVWPSCA
ncbi:hypothetical protein [Massilia sp. KIM]|uniref:hypothetical protein n=1 Tax=Massilia sp. KIM TaxID=1955422 RepID=UPI00117DCDF6|nr:hypothetical protein [Massilia sp. KIM]